MLKSAEDNILKGDKFYMDYYPYTLLEYFRLHRLSWLGKLVVLRKVAESLHWLQNEGICHRDIKPANIMIDINGEPKLIDFGGCCPSTKKTSFKSETKRCTFYDK